MYQQEFGYTTELMQLYYNAIKEGNPDAIVAFNNGVKPNCYKYFPQEEFTSGEQVDLSVIPASRFQNSADTGTDIPARQVKTRTAAPSRGEIRKGFMEFLLIQI